jgi:hypothetical protein
MIRVQPGLRPEAVRQAARHTLFVEGRSPDSIDPEVLGILLDRTKVRVQPMGPSSYIRSVAEALHPHHPDYYFLVDRDHHDDPSVEQTWRNFPDDSSHNLLIWRRRELENYFLIPEYLASSSYLRCSQDELHAAILNAAHQQLWYDIANIIIVELREELKATWIRAFPTRGPFRDSQSAIAQLTARTEFGTHKRSVAQKLRLDLIEQRFHTRVNEFTGGVLPLQFGTGCWHERLRGKDLLPSVIDRCFRVQDTNGRVVRGSDANMAVAKELVRLPLEQQPEDFKQLFQLISARVNS